MTRATWHLKVPGESLGAVDNSRHWNFSIRSTIKGVMAILVERYNSKNFKNSIIMGPPQKHAVAKVAVQQGLMKYVCVCVCVFVSTFEIHLLKAHQANQSTV